MIEQWLLNVNNCEQWLLTGCSTTLLNTVQHNSSNKLLTTLIKLFISARVVSVVAIEILDLECVLCHVTGVQNENKNALINPPSWIFPRSVVYKMSWGEFNLPL